MLFIMSIVDMIDRAFQANTENPDEAAHNEQLNLDLQCFQKCVLMHKLSGFTICES